MKIAVIGSGVSGLITAWELAEKHDVDLFESADYFGGHTATKKVETGTGVYNIDTGFIVYNDRTYPLFEKFLEYLSVDSLKTEMSFSVNNPEIGLEYNGHNLFTLFAQSKNLYNKDFLGMIREIFRFNKLARQRLSENVSSDETLGDFLNEYKFSEYFSYNYILPMTAAIWSASLNDAVDMPFKLFLNFFNNHGLLDIGKRPNWYVIKGGSISYVDKLLDDYKGQKFLNTPVNKVISGEKGYSLLSADSQKFQGYDHVVIATHSDKAMSLVDELAFNYSQVLSDIAYQKNSVVLHTDVSLLPKARRAWASWNYFMTPGESNLVTLTYDMNILQRLKSPETFCVTLNQDEYIDPGKILDTFTYSHPVMNLATFNAQKRRDDINGKSNIWFVGAYWYNGFHEDGVRSAYDVIKSIDSSCVRI